MQKDTAYAAMSSMSLTRPKSASLHCHCKDCQRVTGSGKATVILFLGRGLHLW